MTFREKLFLAFATKYEPLLHGEEVLQMAKAVQYAADACCEAWGHDNQPFFLSRAGSQTIAAPQHHHEHTKCQRCGKET